MRIDLRKEFNSILKEYGLRVILLSEDLSTRCSCYDNLHKSGNSSCQSCLGSGVISKARCVNVVYQSTYANPNNYMAMTEVGLSNNSTVTIYCDNSTKPKIKDKIMIVGRDSNNIFNTIVEMCVVMLCNEVRGDNGRIEYYELMCKATPDKIIKMQNILDTIPSKIKYKLYNNIGGERLVWKKY